MKVLDKAVNRETGIIIDGRNVQVRLEPDDRISFKLKGMGEKRRVYGDLHDVYRYVTATSAEPEEVKRNNDALDIDATALEFLKGMRSAIMIDPRVGSPDQRQILLNNLREFIDRRVASEKGDDE